MKLIDIVEILGLEAIIAGNDQLEIMTACGADLMSDVLAFTQEKSLLLTGLTNPQVVRTAEMIDIKVIIFVRGKRPLAATVELAREKGIYLYLSACSMFECCGILYQNGLQPEEINGCFSPGEEE